MHLQRHAIITEILFLHWGYWQWHIKNTEILALHLKF